MNWQSTFFRYLNCIASSTEMATLYKIGKSIEGRDILVVKISTSNSKSKESIFIGKHHVCVNCPRLFCLFQDGGIHAREWISPATVTGIIQSLVQNSKR